MVGQLIKSIREEKALSNKELSLRSGVSRSMISCIENNLRNATIESLEKIAKGLDISFSKLLLLWSRHEEVVEKENMPESDTQK